MAPIIMDHELKSRMTNEITMESTHIATLQIPVLRKLARQIQISQKMYTDPLISLGVLCDDGCTNTLDKQAMSIHNNGEETIKGTKNKKTRM